jgi:spore germination cell wall hydrolase CwlJ-like protein
LNIKSQTRADARALIGAALIGSATGLALGGVYLAGGMAQTAVQHARISTLAGGASEGFSDAALLATASRMDAGALAVARRHDPYTVTGGAQRDRQAALFAARLERRSDSPDGLPEGLLRASFGGPFNPAAAPFHVAAGALESSRELECLSQAVYYEARGETPSGQAAVAQVVLNRVRHPAFPKSICGVVFQGAYSRVGCQFSFACDGSMRHALDGGAWKRAQKIASRALAGAVMSQVGSATHFHTTGVAPGWGPRMLRVAQVGLHVFYRFGGRGGVPGFGIQHDPSSVEDLPDAPTFASLPPMTAGADGKTAGVFYVASAMAAAVNDAAAPQGMGGPTGPAVEPASAPPEAKPAADTAKASKISADKPSDGAKAVKVSVDKAELRSSAGVTSTGAAS